LPFTKSIYTNSWRRVSHGIRELWDYVRKGVTQIDKRERERAGERERERKGGGTDGRMPKNGAIRIWLRTSDFFMSDVHYSLIFVFASIFSLLYNIYVVIFRNLPIRHVSLHFLTNIVVRDEAVSLTPNLQPGPPEIHFRLASTLSV
jgi:hypothetical protein